jgi:hypothetical protein
MKFAVLTVAGIGSCLRIRRSLIVRFAHRFWAAIVSIRVIMLAEWDSPTATGAFYSRRIMSNSVNIIG